MAKDIKQTKVLKHNKDLKDGFGSVYLPYALNKKYPNVLPLYCMSCSLLCFKTFVCLISLAIVLYVLLFVVF
jgi:hypothetical protein